jgi:hypothetical protein
MKFAMRLLAIAALLLSGALAVVFGAAAIGDTTDEAKAIEARAEAYSMNSITQTALGKSVAALAYRTQSEASAARADRDLAGARAEKVADRNAAAQFLIAALLAGILFMLTDTARSAPEAPESRAPVGGNE